MASNMLIFSLALLASVAVADATTHAARDATSRERTLVGDPARPIPFGRRVADPDHVQFAHYRLDILLFRPRLPRRLRLLCCERAVADSGPISSAGLPRNSRENSGRLAQICMLC